MQSNDQLGTLYSEIVNEQIRVAYKNLCKYLVNALNDSIVDRYSNYFDEAIHDGASRVLERTVWLDLNMTPEQKLILDLINHHGWYVTQIRQCTQPKSRHGLYALAEHKDDRFDRKQREAKAAAVERSKWDRTDCPTCRTVQHVTSQLHNHDNYRNCSSHHDFLNFCDKCDEQWTSTEPAEYRLNAEDQADIIYAEQRDGDHR